MLKGISKKIAIALGLLLGSAGIAFAAFALTFNVSSNTVTAASAGLTITSQPLNFTGLTAGATSAPANLQIKNTGSYAGTVSLKITGATGTLCNDLSLHIDGDKTGDVDPIANGTVSLGVLNPGQTWNLTRTVSMDATSTQLSSSCSFTEQATLVN